MPRGWRLCKLLCLQAFELTGRQKAKPTYSCRVGQSLASRVMSNPPQKQAPQEHLPLISEPSFQPIREPNSQPVLQPFKTYGTAPQIGQASVPKPLPGLVTDSALFLDFDGTLVAIAAQPELVTVPEGLVPLLSRLSTALGGALAIVSGRKMSDLDAYLAPLALPSAAEHGAAQRLADGRLVQLARPPLQGVIRVMLALASEHPGLRVEVKTAAVALHYRHAPEQASLCLETLVEAIKLTPGIELLHGKFVLEVKPVGVSKGSAIDIFMSHPPFAGRTPVFVGDDTTDEAGFLAVQALGGTGIKVGPGATTAHLHCSDPAAVLDWLTAVAETLEAAAPAARHDIQDEETSA